MRTSLTTALLVTAAACGPAMAQGDLGAGVGGARRDGAWTRVNPAGPGGASASRW